MSVDSFKPQLWEGALLANFHSVSIADTITTKPSSIQGNKVTFNRIGEGSIKDYTGTIAWDDINTTPIDMTFTQKKYFAFSLDDVDKVQLKGDVMKATTAEHGAVLAETYDSYVLGKIGSSKKNLQKSKELNPNNVYDTIVDMGTKLSQNKVPKVNRYVIVNAEILGLLSKDTRFTRNPNVLANGVVEGQTINGMQVMATEELPKGKILAIHQSAAGAAKQLSETEAMRLQTAFADGIRGLCVYDSIILRDESIVVQPYTMLVQAQE